MALGYLVDRLNNKASGMDIRKAESSAQRADIFTKCFKPGEWKRVKRNIGILTKEEREELVGGKEQWMPYIGEEDVKVPWLETMQVYDEVNWRSELGALDDDDACVAGGMDSIERGLSLPNNNNESEQGVMPQSTRFGAACKASTRLTAIGTAQPLDNEVNVILPFCQMQRKVDVRAAKYERWWQLFELSGANISSLKMVDKLMRSADPRKRDCSSIPRDVHHRRTSSCVCCATLTSRFLIINGAQTSILGARMSLDSRSKRVRAITLS